jgi:uncharacterized protein YaaR (DUF327 family)
MGEGLARVLAQKLGISEEDVKVVLEMMNNLISDNDINKTISLTATLGEASSKMPEPMQKTIAPMLGYALLRQLSTDPFQKQLMSLAGGLLTVKTLLGSDQQGQQLVNQLLERIDKLNEQIQQMQQARTMEQLESFANTITETIKSIGEEMATLKKRVEELSARPNNSLPQNPLKTVSTQLSEFKETVMSLADALNALGFKVVKPGEKPPVFEIPDEELRKVAEARGYELKPKALTWDEVNRILEERERRLKKWLKKKYERDLKLKEIEAKKWESASAAIIEMIRLARRFVKPEGIQYEGLEELVEEAGEARGGVQETQQGGSPST